MRLMLSNWRVNEHDLCYRCGAQMPESTRHAQIQRERPAVHQTWRSLGSLTFLQARTRTGFVLLCCRWSNIIWTVANLITQRGQMRPACRLWPECACTFVGCSP